MEFLRELNEQGLNPGCVQLPELFFPELSDYSSKKAYEDTIQEARDICEACPVQEKCLTAAVGRHEKDGIWAGVNFNNRKEAKQARVLVKLWLAESA